LLLLGSIPFAKTEASMRLFAKEEAGAEEVGANRSTTIRAAA